jgi:hypothetical protein
MPARSQPASQQPCRPATAPTPQQYPNMPRQLRGPHPSNATQISRPYPNIPQQWTGPAYESIAPQWYGPPPAGLSAPMPVPTSHTIRNVFLGITGLLVGFLVLGNLALSTSSGNTIGAWRDDGGLDRLKALSKDLSAAEETQVRPPTSPAWVGHSCHCTPTLKPPSFTCRSLT